MGRSRVLASRLAVFWTANIDLRRQAENDGFWTAAYTYGTFWTAIK